METDDVLFRDREAFLEDQMERAYGYFRDARNPVSGLYLDFLPIGHDTGYRPASIATTGMGMVALCIADLEGYEDNAADMVVRTLRALTGELPQVDPGRNEAGFFWHFLDHDTGEAIAHVDGVSTVDTSILVAGVLFAKEYFKDVPEVARLADKLYHSIDWEKAIADVDKGAFHWSLDEDGNGVTEPDPDNPFAETFGTLGVPFNEQMVTAYLAANSGSPRARELWDRYYGSPESLPTCDFKGHRLLTDRPTGDARKYSLSHFVPLFCYYLAHPFSESPEYMGFLSSAAKADRESWKEKGGYPDCFWGHGAGTAGDDGRGYGVDTIADNRENIVSPHIISGFLPVHPEGADDLFSIYRDHLGDPATGYGSESFPYGLWRFRADAPPPAWSPGTYVGVDFSLMLFGLAERNHPGFFASHNDYFSSGAESGPGHHDAG